MYKKFSLKELLDQKKVKEIDFNVLMKPYEEGGTFEQPVKRTWGTMLSWLINRHKIPVESVAAAILLVALELKSGQEFEGNNTHGSKGDELAQYIRNTAIEIERRKQVDSVYIILGKKIFNQVEPMISESIRKKLKPWWKRLLGI